jgi:translation initiation factor eIF-2B subunit delta
LYQTISKPHYLPQFRSTVVEQVLLHANQEGRVFSVIVVDSRPMLEGEDSPLIHDFTVSKRILLGKQLLKNLVTAGISCTYVLLPALGSVIDTSTKVLLGAASVHANGAILSRAGTALVAMMASQRQKPVLVCSETYKYSETVPLDGFAKNELGNPNYEPHDEHMLIMS